MNKNMLKDNLSLFDRMNTMATEKNCIISTLSISLSYSRKNLDSVDTLTGYIINIYCLEILRINFHFLRISIKSLFLTLPRLLISLSLKYFSLNTEHTCHVEGIQSSRLTILVHKG